MLGRQPVKDPLGSVPLLARSIKIGPQDPVDRLFMPVQAGLTRGSFFRGSGHAEDSARATVRRPTRYFPARSLLDSPSTRESRRIAAYSSTLDIDCTRASRHTCPSGCGETPGADPPMPAHRWSQDSPTPGPP